MKYFIYFAEFDCNFKMLRKQEFNVPEHLMIHDWAFTDSHYILFGNRIKLNILGKKKKKDLFKFYFIKI